MKTQKGISTIAGITIFIVVAAFAFGGVFAYEYYLKSQIPNPNDQQNPNDQNQTACTTDAKICPDGSSVGRSGPNCEFTACPIVNQTAEWKTFTSDKYSFEIKFPINEMLSQDDISMQERDFYKDSSYKEIFVAMLKYGCDLYVYPNIDDNFLSIIKDTKTYQLSILEHDGKKYYIGYRAASSAVRESDCISAYNQILPTFKFTN